MTRVTQMRQQGCLAPLSPAILPLSMRCTRSLNAHYTGALEVNATIFFIAAGRSASVASNSTLPILVGTARAFPPWRLIRLARFVGPSLHDAVTPQARPTTIVDSPGADRARRAIEMQHLLLQVASGRHKCKRHSSTRGAGNTIIHYGHDLANMNKKNRNRTKMPLGDLPSPSVYPSSRLKEKRKGKIRIK